MALIRDNLEDMHKWLAYLLEKETITGGEMVAIIEGRDPALVEDAYASTRKAVPGSFRPSQPEGIEAPAKHIHIVSEEIKAPPLEGDDQKEEASPEEPKPQEPQPEEGTDGSAPQPSAPDSEQSSPRAEEDSKPDHP